MNVMLPIAAAVLLIGPVAAHRLLFGLRLKDELVTFTGRLATGGHMYRRGTTR